MWKGKYIMALEQLNEKMNQIDKQLGELFVQRMELSAQIAKERAAQNILIPDVAGEREARVRFREQVGSELEGFAGVVYATLQDVSHSYQTIVTRKENTLRDRMAKALETTPQLFPEKATVACQGVEGAYSQLAAEKLFKEPSISYMSSFEAVFSAIANGFCRYGVLPLENSTAGSVNKIYDLMMKYNFSVVRSVRVKIDHSLLARPGVKLEDIKEIYSHEQAIAQCADFLKNHPNIHVTACENTAVAAKMVAQSDRRDIAALSSHNCAELYGLNTLAASVQDKGNNYTRFICIGKELEIFPGADRTSVMLTTPHKPGSLYRIIARINSLGINLTKLESRPLPDRDFEFMFYFDLDTPVYSPKLVQLMGDLESLCDTFRYLGSYSEIV
jgi:chorismate mutase/prephenate dehydratase